MALNTMQDIADMVRLFEGFAMFDVRVSTKGPNQVDVVVHPLYWWEFKKRVLRNRLKYCLNIHKIVGSQINIVEYQYVEYKA